MIISALHFSEPDGEGEGIDLRLQNKYREQVNGSLADLSLDRGPALEKQQVGLREVGGQGATGSGTGPHHPVQSTLDLLEEPLLIQ